MEPVMQPKTIYEGKIRITDVRAVPGDSAFLIDDGTTAVLCDSGFAFTGRAVADNLRQVLGKRTLDYILLTHSHYDHVMAVPHILEIYPQAKVVAGEYTAEVFARSSARQAMCQLNKLAAGQLPPEPRAEGLKVDVTVRDGEQIRCGEMVWTAIHLPGHTKCSFGYYLEAEKLLLSTETLGVYFGKDTYLPAFLVGYELTLESFRKVRQLDIRRILLPHCGLAEGEAAKRFLERSERSSREMARTITQMHLDGKTNSEIYEFLERRDYKDHVRPIYPRDAFRMNMELMIKLVIKETDNGR